MSIFSGNNDGTLRGTDPGRLTYTNEAATTELRSFITSSILDGAPQAHLDRIVKYQLYWLFYEGKHWRQYNETFLSMNYVRAFINKINTFLLGPKGMSLEVVNEWNDPVQEDVEKNAEALINYIWKTNGGVLRQSEILQMGSVCGDVWVMPQYKPNPITGKKFLQILCIDSRHCFPVFENGDTDNLVSMMIRQPLEENKEKYKVLVTEYTKDKIVTWYQKDTVFKVEAANRINTTTTDNPYGFIPVVHIQNKYNSSNYYGFSDMTDIMKLNKTYNEIAQTVKEIIDYYAIPTTIVTGGTIKSITKGLGRIFSGLPAEANVFNLSLGEDLNGTMEFMNLLKTSMHELSDVPENTLGRLQAISNTSAAALQVTYQPLIQQADTKSITYGKGFVELHDMLIRMMRLIEPKHPLLVKLPKDFETVHNVTPVWVYGLPQDETIDLQNADTELRIGTNSRKNILNKLGRKNVPDLLNEIDSDREKEVDRQVRLDAKYNGEPTTE